jgi:hypothetical protein
MDFNGVFPRMTKEEMKKFVDWKKLKSKSGPKSKEMKGG